MLLSKVILSLDAFTPCLSHSLQNENEEIIGLLLGNIDNSTDNSIVNVRRVIALQRKDKKKDRVEIGFENLALAPTIAEKLSMSSSEGMMQESLRVVGWYHSHPHITVFPSHVDVKTQGSYQQFDEGFIGLIFSVFNKGKIQVCAFQSRKLTNGDWERIEVPLYLQTSDKPINREPSRLSSVVSMQTLLSLQKISFNEGNRFIYYLLS